MLRRVGAVGGAIRSTLARWRQRRPKDASREPHPLDPRAVTPSADPEDAFNLLRTAHDQLRSQLEELRSLPIGTREQQAEASAAMHRLVRAAVQHEAVEELELWPVVRRSLEEGRGLAARAGTEELEQRRLLHTLARRRPGDVDWEELLAHYDRLLYHHIVFEQVHVWPPLSRAIDLRERLALGRRIVAARAVAPTRPRLGAAASRRRRKRLDRLIAHLDGA